MKSFVLIFMFLFTHSFAQEESRRTIQLYSGDKITGSVISENDSVLVLRTSYGEISVNKKEIKPKTLTIYLKDGSIVTGSTISSSEDEILLQTSFGTLTIEKVNVVRMTDAGEEIPGTLKQEGFYYGRERLVDIFFDPTGYTLEQGALYISGLSWGVALSDRLDVTSSYWRYFFADLNIRPKFQIYKSGDIDVENAVAVGLHVHSAGSTGKYQSVSEPVYNYQSGMQMMESRWREIGSQSDDLLWSEFFIGITRSHHKADKQGRISYHAGASVIVHPMYKPMPRTWAAIENDITAKFKVIGQVYFDPFQPSYRERDKNKNRNNPFDVDFGFVYVAGENLRVGLHYQPYVFLFYFKF